ncbi:MAG: hypothetical protein AMXMBFR64_50920 [Myxococcales bacterium]
MRVRLDNGLTVILDPRRGAPVVAIQAWVKVGSADEDDAEAGLAHVHEHMLFKGTETRGVGQIAREVEGAGGEINAWTSFDQTVYHVVMSSRELDRGLDIMADALQRSAFDADELGRELEVILEEIKRADDAPSRVASRMLFETAYRAHPYRKPVIGTRESVRAFTRDAVTSFYEKWYTADNMVLVVGGDFDAGVVLPKVEAAFAGLRRGALRKERPAEPPQGGLRCRVERGPFAETQMLLAIQGPDVEDPDVAALDLLTLILGQGESSRLNLQVKRELGIVNEVSAYSFKMRDPGLIVLSAQLAARDVEAAYEECLRRLLLLRAHPVGEDELDKAKTLIESTTVYEKETVQGMASKHGWYEVVAGGIAWEARYYEAVRRATPDELLRVARRWLDIGRLSVVLLMQQDAPELPTEEALRATAERIAREADGARAVGPSGTGVVRHRVENGPLLVIDQDASVPLIAMRAVFGGGLRFETPADGGVGTLMSQCLTRGTPTRTAADIARELDRTASGLGGFMRMNSIGVRGELLTRRFTPGLGLLADCVLNASYPEGEVAREKALHLEEIRAQEDHLSSAVFRAFARTLYGTHPYGLPVLGTEASVRGMSREILMAHHHRYLHPGRMTLAVVGDVDPDRVIEEATALFGGRGDRPVADPAVVAPHAPEHPRETVEHRDRQQAHMAIGFLGTTVASEDRFALDVLSTVLGGQGGRLFLELRDRRSLAYSVGAWSVEGIDPGYFVTYIGTSPDKLDEAERGIEAELSRVTEELVSEAELDRARSHIAGSHDISLQRRGARAGFLAFNEAYGLGYESYGDYGARVRAVTAEDVRAVAERVLRLDRRVRAVIRPES